MRKLLLGNKGKVYESISRQGKPNILRVIGYLEGYFDQDMYEGIMEGNKRGAEFRGEDPENIEVIYDEYVMVDGELVKKEG